MWKTRALKQVCSLPCVIDGTDTAVHLCELGCGARRYRVPHTHAPAPWGRPHAAAAAPPVPRGPGPTRSAAPWRRSCCAPPVAWAGGRAGRVVNERLGR